jgi:hypothetical protein
MATQEAVIQTDAALAAALVGEGGDGAAEQVRRLVRDAGGVLSPTFPGSTGQLATYFHCFVEPADFGRVDDELRSQPGVLAAYLKPGDALP